MDITIDFKPDKEYYEEAYNEIVSSLKYKKYEPYLASGYIIGAIVVYYFDTSHRLEILSLIFGGLGLFRLISFFAQKKKWIKDRMDSKVAGQSIKLEFNDTSIIHSGPFSNGEISWNGIKNIVKTKNGILLKPENGLSIYLPDRLFDNKSQIDFIMSKKDKC